MPGGLQTDGQKGQHMCKVYDRLVCDIQDGMAVPKELCQVCWLRICRSIENEAYQLVQAIVLTAGSHTRPDRRPRRLL